MSAVAYPSFRPQPTRLVLTRRGRRVISFLIALPLAIGALFAAVAAGDAAATDAPVSNTSTLTWITVESGETLWSLAEELAPTKDPRDVIAEIVSLNQLHSELQPGQHIALPAGF
jgi:hypothetical protein